MLQFGYNTGVINAPEVNIENFMKDVYKDRYGEDISEEFIQQLYSVAVSIFAIGGMLGGFSGGWMANRFGRWVIYIAQWCWQSFIAKEKQIVINCCPPHQERGTAAQQRAGHIGCLPHGLHQDESLVRDAVPGPVHNRSQLRPEYLISADVH